MNSKNNKTSDSHRLSLNLKDKIIVKRSDKDVALSNLSIYYTWKNVKNPNKNNQLKISEPTWNEEFQLPNESYSVSNIQYYFKHIIKKYGLVSNNPSVKIYVNQIENKDYVNLELLTLETVKLLGRTKSKITKDENGANVLCLEIAEVVLVRCNIVNNDCQ